MRRHQQLVLPLGQVDLPEKLLRAAWERSRLSQSFEEAMQLTHLRIGLKYVALVIAKQRGKRR
jgi:hypothetical protein